MAKKKTPAEPKSPLEAVEAADVMAEAPAKKGARTKAAPKAAKAKAAPKAAKAKAGKGTGPSVVVVESPAKERTIGKFLGKGFVVKSSYGHVRDLPEKKMGVEEEKGFEPTYVVL